jgi:hypothetical protein
LARNMTRYYIILLLILAFITFSCLPRLKVEKMTTDRNTGIYYYNSILPLRVSNGEVLTRENLDSFLIELANNNEFYDFNKFSENDLLVTQKDANLVDLYSEIIVCINSNKCDAAIELIRKFKADYPLSEKHTDINFLLAYAWEKASNPDSAKYYFKEFFKFSGRRYSQRFRGYAFNDSNSVVHSQERNYARSYISNSVRERKIHLAQIKPKYYYESFSQGFVLNREDIGMYRKRILSAGLGIAKNNTMVGVGVSELFNDKVVLNASYYFSSWQNYVRVTLPYQLYKSSNNRFGIKITPTCDYAYVKQVDERIKLDDWYINPGLTPSIGFRLTHRIFFGISYTYSLYNQHNKKYFSNSNQYLFGWSELDISAYYQLIKGVSLKIGTSDGYPIFGLNMLGIFLGYSTNPHASMVRFNDF